MLRRNLWLTSAVVLTFSTFATFAMAAPKGMAIVSKVAIPAGGKVVTTVKLPPGTHKVDFADETGSFYCQSVTLSAQDGSESNVFTRSEMPANFHMTTGAAPGSAFVSANIDCRGGAATAQLVVAVSP